MLIKFYNIKHCDNFLYRNPNYVWTSDWRSSILLNITPYSALKVNQFQINMSPRSPSWSLHSHECENLKSYIMCYLLHVSFFAWLILPPWKWNQHIILICWLIFSGLHSIICQKISLITLRYICNTGSPSPNTWK